MCSLKRDPSIKISSFNGNVHSKLVQIIKIFAVEYLILNFQVQLITLVQIHLGGTEK